GVAAALAAGMRVIGFPDPRMDRRKLAGADFIVSSYDEMLLLDLRVREGEKGGMFGIVGYGADVPRYSIRISEIAAHWGRESEGDSKGTGLVEKTVPGMDEDTITIAVEAARHALVRAGIEPRRVGALYVGSESHPYAVKPSGTVVAEALGI